MNRRVELKNHQREIYYFRLRLVLSLIFVLVMLFLLLLALGHAIAGLTAAYPAPRIVTTNYDRHLTSAATALSLDLDVYEAPALPVGDDFEGIVHLHGSGFSEGQGVTQK